MVTDIYTTDRRYGVIYADPPWSYYNDMSVGPDCTTVRGMRRPPYPVLSVKDICSIPVERIACDDCILFIWTTDYHLERCMEVIRAWGFTYRTVGFVWAKKTRSGKQVSFAGAYTKKSGCELCLIATRGKDAHRMVVRHDIDSFLEYPRMEHSRKPDEIRERIGLLTGPDVPKIELFARREYEGWDCWGNEV